MSNLFRTIATAISGPARTRKVPQTTRRVHLDLEVLGGRTLLSVSPILSVAVHTPIAHLHPSHCRIGWTYRTCKATPST